MGLENMSRLSILPQVAAAVKRSQAQIIESLHDPDISIRRRALDLLFGMTDMTNAESIVKELLDYLIVSDFAIREELVLRIAILAEKFMPTQRWYIDVTLTLIDKAGDFVSDDIWCFRCPASRHLLSAAHVRRHRVVQIVTNNGDLQSYAAEQALLKLQAGSAHETMVKVGGYLLGEFGHLLSVPCAEYLGLLQQRFPSCGLQTKALLLSAFAKLVTHTSDPLLVQQINAVFERYHAFADVELQQRSVEYFTLTALHSPMLKDVLAEMPKFPTRASALVKKVAGAADSESSVPESLALRSVRPDAPEQPALPLAAYSAQRLSASGLGDLLDEGPAIAAPVRTLDDMLQPALHAAPPPPSAQPLSELDMFFGGGASTSRAEPPPRQLASVPLQDPQLWLRKLAVADSGVLYEDAHVQLGVKAEWRSWAGRATLFLGNKHTSPLVQLRAELTQVPGLRLSLAELPPSVGDRQQVSVQLSAACAAPFAQSPLLTLSYVLSDTRQEVTFTARLAIFTTKFLVRSPPLEPAKFYEAWRALVGPQKMEAIIRVKAELAAGGLAAWNTLLDGLRIFTLPGVDPNPLNLFAASMLSDESGGSTLVITRLESDVRSSSQFRVTVASSSTALAAAVHGHVLALSEA